MKILLPFIILLMPFLTFAESKLSVDLTIDSLHFQRPLKGVGKAGNLIFKNANVNNNGIILNINNVNNLFDSQIFIRPTFLGFTTQFGNYGFSVEEEGLLNDIKTMDLTNSKLILDDGQLNISGEDLAYIDSENNIKLQNFRLYCQSPFLLSDVPTAPASGLMANLECGRFLSSHAARV